MLRELRVKNFAIVEDGALELGAGMTAFTGETGAGKSLLFDAVTLLLGGKARAQLVRGGASHAEVEGLFDLSNDVTRRGLAAELGFAVEEDEGHMLVIRREISSGEAAKNRIWIQGRSATRGQLQSLLGDWVEVSGQHEFLKLGRDQYILRLVDEYGGLSEDVAEFESLYAAHVALEEELAKARGEEESRATRMDYLRFQIEELDKAGIGASAAEEEQRSLALRAKLGSAEKIRRAFTALRAQIEGGDEGADGALARVQAGVRELRPFADLDGEISALLAELESCEACLGDLSRRAEHYADNLEADPAALEDAESFLSRLSRIKRKHNKEVVELVDMAQSLREELHGLENIGERITDLTVRFEASAQRAWDCARQLHTRREQSARVFAKAWQKGVRALGMKHARLELAVAARDTLGALGMTEISALFSANPGESPQPLAKVASGGELSRILLSLKALVASRSEIAVYLFDEVDAGIGGETAHVVATRLREISKHNQVLVVTHLPQVAAKAHAQFRILKLTQRGRTRTLIESLGKPARVGEISRMLGGSSSKTAEKLARELLGE
jgi:DNA repair protein RecN (Recombination protein N)